jgi:hypothetical protein
MAEGREPWKPSYSRITVSLGSLLMSIQPAKHFGKVRAKKV